MLAANPTLRHPTFSAPSAQLPSTSGHCFSAHSFAPPRSVGCQLSAVSYPVSPFPATLASSLQIAEKPAALSPAFATLTSRVKHKSCVCHSYKKHPGSHPSSQIFSFRSLATHQSRITKSFIIRTYAKCSRNPFGMNTSKTKGLKLFRINTYKKTGGGVPPLRVGMTEGEERSLQCGRDDRLRRDHLRALSAACLALSVQARAAGMTRPSR
jgi:hypothetical protein